MKLFEFLTILFFHFNFPILKPSSKQCQSKILHFLFKYLPYHITEFFTPKHFKNSASAFTQKQSRVSKYHFFGTLYWNISYNHKNPAVSLKASYICNGKNALRIASTIFFVDFFFLVVFALLVVNVVPPSNIQALCKPATKQGNLLVTCWKKETFLCFAREKRRDGIWLLVMTVVPLCGSILVRTECNVKFSSWEELSSNLQKKKRAAEAPLQLYLT